MKKVPPYPDKNKKFPNPNLPHSLPGKQRLCFIKNCIKRKNIIVGDYTYYDDNEEGGASFEKHVTHHYPYLGDKLIIGNFVCIGKGVEFIMNGANHTMCSATTYPFYIFNTEWNNYAPHKKNLPFKGNTIVGNDVWIGQNVTILPGVKIGDGAIVGANSIVAKDVKPYTVVAGNPAKIIKKRFDDKTIKHLLKIKWWNWDIKKITKNLKYLTSNNLQDIFKLK